MSYAWEVPTQPGARGAFRNWAIALVRHRRRGAGCGRLLRRQRDRELGDSVASKDGMSSSGVVAAAGAGGRPSASNDIR